MNYLTIFLFLFSFSQVLSAQGEAVARLDSAWAETGDTFLLHVAVPMVEGKPSRVDFTPWDSIMPKENVLRQSPWTRIGKFWMTDLTLIYFDSAMLSLPGLRIQVSGNEPVTTNGVQLEIYPTPAPRTPQDLADIKDIRREPFRWLDLLPWILIIGGVALLILGYWFFFRKKTGANSRLVELSPHELALKKLEQLGKKNLPYRLFYDELTFILREYLQKRFGIPALESTSAEIVNSLAQIVGTANGHLAQVGDLLLRADLVKYANTPPDPTAHGPDLSCVKQFVLDTVPVPQPDNA